MGNFISRSNNEKSYNPDLIENMKNSGCLIEDDIDEIKLLDFYKLSSKYSQNSLALRKQ